MVNKVSVVVLLPQPKKMEGGTVIPSEEASPAM